MKAGLLAAATGLFLTGCASPIEAAPAPGTERLGGTYELAAKIVPTSKPLQCVPYARRVSGIEIRGDAWTWWTSAKGRYARGRAPRVGSVLVLNKTRRLRRGHLAVVKQVVGERVIVVDQANWLNRGRIHLNTAVLDVSPGNDWSAVRVWYTPGRRYGTRTYPAYGFIYPDPPAIQKASRPTTRTTEEPANRQTDKEARRPAATRASQDREALDARRG